MAQSEEERRAKKAAANKSWRERNREKHRAGVKRYNAAHREERRAISRRAMARRRMERPAEYFYKALKARAQDGRSAPKDFDLTEAFIEKLLEPMVCSKTGIPLTLTDEGNAQAGNPWAPSIDRIDSTRGYTQDNVQLVCWAFNMAKGPWSEEVFRVVAQGFLEKQHG